MKITLISKKIIYISIITIVLIFTFSLFGCKTSNQKKDNETVTTNQQETGQITSETSTDPEKETASNSDDAAEQEAIMKDFDKLLANEVRSYQVVLFIDENISKVSFTNADLMLEKLEYIQKSDRQFYTDLLFEGDWQQQLNKIFNRDIEIKDLGEIKDEKLKKIATEIFNGGFKLIALEGSFYPYIDYDFLRKYLSYLSQQYKDCLNIMAQESNKIYSRDAALTISWNELSFRLINCEQFLISSW